MLQLIYASRETTEFGEKPLGALLEKAREHNEQNNITGFLLYISGNFLQVLEGPDEAVKTIFNSIEQDARHSSLKVIAKNEIQEREFDNWSMAFKHVLPETAVLEVFLDFEKGLLEALYEESYAKRVLRVFQRMT
jgi:uncharacterized Fe-S cluster-containing MiaB family protein